MSWHIDTTTAERYADGRLDSTGSASVEAHLERCAACRSLVGGAVAGADQQLLDAVWYDLTAALDQPTLGRVESTLRRVGVGDATARIVAGTRQARHTHLVASMLCVVLAVLASRSAYDELFVTFLALAPLGPLLATAWAFGRRSDVTGQLTGTLPYSPLRMLLVRTAAAVTPAVLLTAVSLPWLLDRGWLAVAWLLPSFALVVGAIALSSWMPIEWAAIGVATVWFGGVLTLRIRVPLDDLVEALSGPVQIVSLVSAAAGAVVIVVRRTAYEYREV